MFTKLRPDHRVMLPRVPPPPWGLVMAVNGADQQRGYDTRWFDRTGHFHIA